MEFNYQQIKQLAKEIGRPVTDLIALAAQNDPFYVGTPAALTLAEWFADFYHNNYIAGTRVHIRRCHYKIVSLGLSLPNGKPYENTEECWNTLCMASKAARYLKLVDIALFEDKRNDDPVDYSQRYTSAPGVAVNDTLYTSDIELPEFPSLPSYDVDSYEAIQPYHLEVWCEKTTMNDVLLPLCQRYGMVLQTGAGELSITATAQLAERLERSGKPARIFYISDFDPAGQSMPVAISRKLEYFVRDSGLDADIRLFPVILTAEQVRQYRLPRTPIKETERRRNGFEERHGTGAVELDALEALRPGELQRVLERNIERYYDVELERKTWRRRRELQSDLETIRQSVLARHTDQIDAIKAELEGIHTDLAPRMRTYSQHVQELWLAISRELQENTPDIDAYPLPEGAPANELGAGLYDSHRDYLEQIRAYKQFQGKDREQ